jgi:hypothetical protein
METSDETILRRELRTYTTFKVHFGFEHYLSVIGNFEHRRCLTKLRISAHRLHVETGRYQGIPPHQRLCGQCDSGEVENEKFIFYFAAANLERSDNSCSEQYLNRVTIFYN